MKATYPTFTRQQELDLFRRYRSGDQEAGNQLALSVMPLVYKLLRKADRRNRLVWDDEVESVAHFVIGSAIKKFDVNSGYRFTSYAGTAATKSGVQELWHNGALTHVPKSLMDSPENLSDNERKLRSQALDLNSRCQSLDVEVVSGSRSSLRDFVPDESESFEDQIADQDERDHMRAAYNKALKRIAKKDPRAADIIRQRLESERTLKDIGSDYGISKERVRQIHNAHYPQFLKLTKRYFKGRR